MFTHVLSLLAGCGLTGSPSADGPAASTEPEPNRHAEELAAKGAMKMVGAPKKDPIDWVAAKKHHKLNLASIPQSAKDTLNQAGTYIPVLLPTDPELLKTLSLYAGDGWYAATLNGDGHQVFIRGTHRAHEGRLSKEELASMMPKHEIQITRTEGIVTANFAWFGSAYNLEIECDEADNPLCNDDEQVKTVVKQLGFADGKMK